MNLETMDFSSAFFWIQVHVLPLEYLTPENGIRIGERIGNTFLIDCDDDNIKGFYKFIRIQIEIDLKKPLVVGFLHNENDL